MITCHTDEPGKCPGNGSFHETCISSDEICENYICVVCREQAPKPIPEPENMTLNNEEPPELSENELIYDELRGDEELDITEIELPPIPAHKKKVERIIGHHYISRSYKNGDEMVKKLHFKVKWSGYSITEYEPVETLYQVEATEAMKIYLGELSKRAMSTLIKRQPKLVQFLKDE